MKALLSATAARANDHYTIHSLGVPERELILRVARYAMDILTEGYDLGAPCIVCGHGNNGADGFALAGLLCEIGCKPTIVYTGKLTQDARPDTSAMSVSCKEFYEQAVKAGIPILCHAMPAKASVTVDAIFGIGLHGEIPENICRVIDAMNQSGTPILAIDIPSGVYADTGEIAQTAVCATETMTVQSDKPGLHIYPGAGHAGKVTVADVGIEPAPDCPAPLFYSLEQSDLSALLPPRPTRSHKGTFGRVLLITGSDCMAGAAYMAAMGAFRSGAGLVEIFTPEQNRIILQQLVPEAILTCYSSAEDVAPMLNEVIARADAIVLGCGLGRSQFAAQAVAYTLKTAKVPLVLDADALNLIAAQPAMLQSLDQAQKAQIVMTPHAAEAARLLGCSITDVTDHVYKSAQSLALQYGTSVLLKDAHNLIYAHDGSICYVNPTGSTALSTAGSGDILAGVMGGLAAAKTNAQPTHTTAALAAYLHGLAGQRAEQSVGARAAMARDILQGLVD